MRVQRVITLNKQIIYLSLVCLVSLNFLLRSVGATREQSGLRGNRSDESDSENVLNSVSIEENPNEEAIINIEEDAENDLAVDDDDDDDKQPNSNKSSGSGQAATFTWSHHHEDHGLYAGRSLLSSASGKPHELYGTQGDKADVDSGADDETNEEVDGSSSSSSPASKRLGRARVNNEDAEHQDDPLKTIDYAEKEWQLMFRAFDSAYDSLSSSVLQEIGRQTNLFDDIVSKLKGPCRRDIYYIRESIKKHKLWALRMVDSNGKLPSGITYGRFSSPGDYEECLSVQVDDKLYKDVKNNIVERHKFHGKYCLLDFRLPLPERPRDKLLSVHESVLNFTGTEIGRKFPEMIANYSGYASVFYEIGYLHAFCLPSTCDVKDLARSMTKALEGMYLIVNNTVDCEERPVGQSKPIRVSQWISIALMTIVFLNAAFASFAYYLLPKEVRQPSHPAARGKPAAAAANNTGANNSKTTKITSCGAGSGLRHTLARGLSTLDEKKGNKNGSFRQRLVSLSIENKFYSDCFSIQTNFERLTKPDPRGLTFVHYTRIVAMALTVITHTGALGTLQAITKPADASNSEQIFRDLIPQMLANAFTSIQIFFFMAGFMLVISTFPSIKRDKGHVSFLEYAIKRAIRLMPGLAATICLNFIWPLLVDGPMLTYFDRMIVEPCESTWWHTMAFMSNFDHVEKMCLRHSYFSASDYQLHIMAFPLLILLYKQPSLALFLATLLTISGFVAQIIMILTKTVLPFMMVDYIDREAFFNVVHYIHHPVWNHMSAFFYGFIVGYLVVKQIRVNLSATTIKRLWFIMIPAGVISIFAPYFWNHYKRPIEKWQMVLYAIFDRSVLLTTCAWLSYATMVLARKPATKKTDKSQAAASTFAETSNQQHGAKSTVKSPIERVLSKTQTASLDNFEKPKANIIISSPSDQRLHVLGGSNSSLSGMPRQRSSPNLVYLQQQQQQQHGKQQFNFDLGATIASGRLSRTTSSSNLATIAETSQPPPNEATFKSNEDPAEQQQQQQRQPARPRSPPPVNNLNTLCLVLSRLTFQLYLFNMVVLWIDVNHSKYYWFFSYYFIIFKASAIYIASALLAMIFFVVLESPSLTLYIAWVKGRAAARAKRSIGATRKVADITILVPPPLTGKEMELTSASSKPTFSFIDHDSATPTLSAANDKNNRRQESPPPPPTTTTTTTTNSSPTNETYRPTENQTKM